MSIWGSQEHPLFNLERLDMLCALIGHASETLWPFAFLESFRCSISSVSICYTPELDMLVKSYDHLNFMRASVVQFLAFRYNMSSNRTSELKVLTIWVSRELPLFNFERLDMLCAWTRHASENYDHLNLSRASVVQFLASRYNMSSNRTCEWKAMIIRISWEPPLFNFKRLDIICPRIRNPSEKLWPFEVLKSIRCSIWSVSICYAP